MNAKGSEKNAASPSRRLARRVAASLGVVLVVAGVAWPALAEPQPELAAPATVSLSDTPLHHQGLAVSVGGGVTAYTDGRTRDALGTGGYWEVRGLLGARSFLGNELAYVGSTRAINGAGAAAGAGGQLLGNGVEMAARLNLPLQLAAVRVAPFVFVGPGFSRLSIVGRDAAPPGARTTDTLLVLTSGGGIAVTYRKLVVGTRFTYRQTFGADLIRTGDDSARLQSWSLALTAGHEL